PSGHERASIKNKYIMYFKRLCSGEQAPALRNKTASGICRSSRAKPELAFIYIGQRPMLWLFRPYRGCLSYFCPQKSGQNSSLKIFALAACRYVFLLLSANICQAILFGQEGSVLFFVAGYL